MSLYAPSVSVLALLAAFAGSPAAQDLAPGMRKPEVRGTDLPIRAIVQVIYDVQHDRITSLSRTNLSHASEAWSTLALGSVCFDNSDVVDTSSPGYIVANSGEDMLAWGSKNCTGASRLRNFTIAYRSEAIDPSQGGPGAVLSIALRAGANGFGRPGTEIFRRTLTGLPSNDGVQNMVLLTVDFGTNPLPLADGAFGWTFLQMDGDTGPVAVRAPKLLLGTADALDIYSPGPAQPSTYIGTFNYGGCSNYPFQCANMWIQLDEIANSEVANSTVLNGSGTNPVLLSEIFPARIGSVWAARVNATVPSAWSPPYTILFTSLASFGPASSPYGEILIDPSQRLLQPIPGEAGYSFALPADTSLIGFVWYTQAAVLPPALPAITLTNSLRIRIGY